MKPACYYILTIVLSICTVPAYAQKTAKASASYTMKVENNMTWDDAVKKAIQYAQVKAIEETFGKVIVQDNSSFVKNEQNGEMVKTSSTFNFISNSYIKGEWVSDINEPQIEKRVDGTETWITVLVKGKVRELITPGNNFIAYMLNCPEEKCRTTGFNDGQDLFLYFKSASDGYLSVYVTDPTVNYTFQLLPYKHAGNRKCVKITADKEYIFFSRKHDYYNEASRIDEQVASLSPGSESEKYQLWMLFAPSELEKPVLEDETVTTQKFLDANSIRQGYTLPRGMHEEKFAAWLQHYRMRNKAVEMSSLFFNVIKP